MSRPHIGSPDYVYQPWTPERKAAASRRGKAIHLQKRIRALQDQALELDLPATANALQSAITACRIDINGK